MFLLNGPDKNGLGGQRHFSFIKLTKITHLSNPYQKLILYDLDFTISSVSLKSSVKHTQDILLAVSLLISKI